MCKKIGTLFISFIMLLMLASCVEVHDPVQDVERNEVLVSLLTPQDAEIITNIEDLLILDSKRSLPELIDFYKFILFELGAEETGINDKREGIWIFSGIYDRTKPITIEMRDSIDHVRVYVIY